jgi:outer membrane autotransporter protein
MLTLNNSSWLRNSCRGFIFGLLTTMALRVAAVTLAIDTSPLPATLHEELTYNIKLTTTEPIENTTLNYLLPPGLTLLTAAASQGHCQTTAVVTCQLGQLTNLAVITIRVQPTLVGNINNEFSVTGLDHNQQVVLAQQTVAVTVNALAPTTTDQPPAQLAMTVATSPATALLHEDLTYQLQIFPIPVAAAINQVVFTYGLPPNFNLRSSQASQGNCQFQGVLECHLGVLNQAATITIVVMPTATGNSNHQFHVRGLDSNSQVIATTETVDILVNRPAPVQVSLSETVYTATETQASVTITVNRSGDSDRAISVGYRTQDGSALAGHDYQPTQGRLQWSVGDITPKEFTITLIQDLDKEPDETLTILLTEPEQAVIAQGQAELIIQDPNITGEVGFHPTTYTINEASQTVTLTVIRAAGADGNLAVNYFTQDGTALAGQDYETTAGTLTWQPGESSEQEIVVTIINDAQPEWEQTFQVILTQPTNQGTIIATQATATITIEDDTTQYSAEQILMAVAQNPTQQALAQHLGHVCQSGQTSADLSTRCREMLIHAGSNPSEVAKALQQIAPEEFAAQGRLATTAAARQVRNIYTRLMALRSGAIETIDFRDLQFHLDGQKIPLPTTEDSQYRLEGKPLASQGREQPLSSGTAHALQMNQFGIFVNGHVGWGDRNTTANETGFEFDSIGLTGGADYRWTDQLIVGAALGYSLATADLNNNSGSIEVDGLNLSLYGSFYQPKKFYLDMLYSYGMNAYDNRRSIIYTLEPDMPINQAAHSEPEGEQQIISFSAGYHWYWGQLGITPTFRLDQISTSIDSFTESMADPEAPGAGLAVTLDDQTIKSLTLAMGTQLAVEWSSRSGITWIPQVNLEWVTESKTGVRWLRGRLVDYVGEDRFALATDEVDGSYMNLGLGLAVQWRDRWSAFVNYETLWGVPEMSSSSLMGGIRMEF